MPTPFTHLETAQRLLRDPLIPTPVLALLSANCGPFLLGNISADARVETGSPRETTHFYTYREPIVETPWRAMLRQYPTLETPSNPAAQAFLAGYVAHLAMDELWSKEMVGPYFVRREWAAIETRLLMLHVLLTYVDTRDYGLLESWQVDVLSSAQPNGWLPFISDSSLSIWRDAIVEQMKPDGQIQTVAILAERIARPPQDLLAILESPERMESDLWANVPQEALAQVEENMYAYARPQMCLYLEESQGS